MASTATIHGTVFMVMSNMMGAGMLSLPYTFKRASVLPGALAMITMCAANALSFVVLARCAELSGAFSYKGIAEAALGKRASAAIAVVMTLYTLGSCISYVVLLGDFLPRLVLLAPHSSFVTFVARPAVVDWAVSLLVLFPLALQRDLSRLSGTSTFAFACVCYAVGLVAVSALSTQAAGDVHWFAPPQPASVFVAFPIALIVRSRPLDLTATLYFFGVHTTIFTIVPPPLPPFLN